MPSLLTEAERGKFLAETPVWKMNRTQYQAARGVHQPWIAEISPMQYGGLSGRGRRAYDAKRSQEWAASGACKTEYDRLVFEAYKRGEFKLKDEGVTKDAESAVAYLSAQEKQADREERLRAARRANQILHVDDAEEGDRVFIVGYSQYATVVKKLKVSFSLKAEGSGREFKIAAGACVWLSYNDLVKAVDEGRAINPHGDPDLDPEPTPPAAAAIPPAAASAATSCARSTPQTIEARADEEEAPTVTVERAEELIRAMMEKHGLTARGWTYKFDQTRHRLASCHEEPGNNYLSFSVPFILCNREEVLVDSIGHEVAHALAGAACGHGRRWQLHALAVGCKPEAACGREVVSPDSRYHAVCPNCGHRITRAILPRARKGALTKRVGRGRRQRTGPLEPVATYCSGCLDKFGRSRESFDRLTLTWIETATGRVIEWPPKSTQPAAAAAQPPPAAPAPEIEQQPAPKPTPEPEPETWEVKPITHATQPSLF
ncbi:MAG TPA: hypothetical protein VGB98_25750 [Pyrinomonadaceae bacterium]|jgi:DNA-directed RNA polymerase subunit RPC12/RpoP